MTAGTVGVVGFAALLVTAVLLEVAARRRPGRATAVQAIGAAMRTTPGRLAVLGTWVWLGVHFLAR